jgi:aminodeoxyfutalosine deaminase
VGAPNVAEGELDGFIRALPKVDLHVHLLGSASPETVADLARAHPTSRVPADVAELAAFYAFRDFAHFIEVYRAVNELVTAPADIVTLVRGLGRDLAATGVRYAEVTVTAVSHLRRGIDGSELGQALEEGRRQAQGAHGVELAWVIDVPGDRGVAAARQTLDWIVTHAPNNTVAFGLGGPEVDVDRRDFAAPFLEARSLGLHSVPHAGETVGPESVWAAIDDLGAERVGHGIRAADDPRLVETLAAREITLEVCPTSNLCTGAVAHLDDHPLSSLLRAGVAVTIGSDDPGMFATDLVREYQAAAASADLDREGLAGLARTGVEASFMDQRLKASLRSGIADTLAAWSPAP